MSERLVLAIDVGNSRIKAGLFTAPAATELPFCRLAMAMSSNESDPAGTIRSWLDAQSRRPIAAVVGGSNPPAIERTRSGWNERVCELLLPGRPAPTLLHNRTDEPERVGPDRLFDAVAANRIRPPGVAAIVVDSGTATTVNFLDGAGAFCGGAILAGFELIATALHERTALLPRVNAANLAPPPEPLGRNTEQSLRSGLYWGLVGGVKELVARLGEEAIQTTGKPPMLVLTGGASPLLAEYFPAARAEPHLTLQGIVLAASPDGF